MLQGQLLELLRLLDVRRVASILEHYLAVETTATAVLVEHVAGLAHHRLRRKDLFARPAGDRADLPQEAQVEERSIRDDLIVRSAHPQYGRLGIYFRERA